MDYTPVACRTRSRTAKAVEKAYVKVEGKNGWGSPRSKKMRRSECASVSKISELSSMKKTVDWVAGDVVVLGEQEDDVLDDFNSEKSFKKKGVKHGNGERVAVGVKRKRSLKRDDLLVGSNKDGCHSRASWDTSEKTKVKTIDVMDSDEDDEEVVCKGEEGDDEDDVEDDGDGDNVSDDESDENDSSEFEEEETTEDGDDDDSASLSDEVTSEEESEEEIEVSEKSEKARKSVEVLKRKINGNGDDQLSSSGHDSSVKTDSRESVQVGKKGNGFADGDDLHACSGNETGVRFEKVWIEGSVGVGAEENSSADKDDLHSPSGPGPSANNRSENMGNNVYDRSDYVGKAKSVPAGGRTVWSNRRGDETDYRRHDEKYKTGSKIGSANRVKVDSSNEWKIRTRRLKAWSDKRNDLPTECQKSEEVSSLAQKINTRRQRAKRVPTVAFVAPKVCLPQRWSIAEPPTVPEKSENEKEIEEIYLEFISAGIADATDSDSKVKVNNFTESFSKQKDDNDETYVGSSPEQHKKNEGAMKRTNRNSITAGNDCSAFKILVDSIYKDEEVSEEQLDCFGNDSPKDEAPKAETLPLLFGIDHPPSPKLEKSAFEIEVDNLFNEFEFIRTSCEIDYANSDMVEADDSAPPGKELTQHMLCGQGKHHLVLDEEVGLICEFCTYVHREIKYIVPGFAPNPYGKHEKRIYEEDDMSKLHDIQCNVPDDSGCNSQVQAEGTVWDLIPGVEKDMYPHQREGFEFIWRHIAGGIQLGKLEKGSYDGNGCIISHAPGTGKTRLTIVFIQSYMNLYPTCRPLIVAPRTMLLTWEEEFKKWGFDIPFHNLNNLNFTGKEDEQARNLVKDVKSSRAGNVTRIVKLKSWAQKRSILGIGYQLFEKICGAPNKNRKGQDAKRKKFESEEMRKILFEFPGLVILDEGHNARNEQSYLWNALLKIKTRRCILLSGTPFQNSFDELNNTIRLVRPEWKMQGQKYRVENSKGTSEDVNSQRAKEIKAEIAPFVHVYKGTILQDKLPGLRSAVVVLQPTDLQQRFLDRTQLIKLNNFKDEHIEAKVSVHPSLLLREEASLLLNKEYSILSRDDQYAADWAKLGKIRLIPEGGVKVKFVVDLIRLCKPWNERVLVFSQWIDPLALIMEILESQFQWKKGVELVYMDGKCDGKERQSSMSYFNDPSSKAKVLLACTKSCNEGINLVGASRVVLLDVTWNPAVERQAISRAYRLGQKKIVFIYHLLMAGAKEEGKYSRQVEKHRLSELVFSCSNKEAGVKNIRAAVAEDQVLEEMLGHEKLKHIFQRITLIDETSYLNEEFEF